MCPKNAWLWRYRSSRLTIVFCKKLFLKISQNSQEYTCAWISFLIKLQAYPATLLKKRFRYWCFPVNFAKCLKTASLLNTSGRLLTVFWCFQGVEKGCIGNKWVNDLAKSRLAGKHIDCLRGEIASNHCNNWRQEMVLIGQFPSCKYHKIAACISSISGCSNAIPYLCLTLS